MRSARDELRRPRAPPGKRHWPSLSSVFTTCAGVDLIATLCTQLTPLGPDASTAFMAHGEFLVRNKRYSKAVQATHDPYAFAAEVARAGYATDPFYERVLKGVMRTIEKAGGFKQEAESFDTFESFEHVAEPLHLAWESS